MTLAASAAATISSVFFILVCCCFSVCVDNFAERQVRVKLFFNYFEHIFGRQIPTLATAIVARFFYHGWAQINTDKSGDAPGRPCQIRVYLGFHPWLARFFGIITNNSDFLSADVADFRR